MFNWFRNGFYSGLSLVLLLGLFLLWLWRPEHQVRLHTDNLLRAIAHKNWPRFAEFIAGNYRDQWGNDRTLLLERTREVFRYLSDVQIAAVAPNVRLENNKGFWRGIIRIDGRDNELMSVVKERVNNLGSSFELEWHHVSAKPWDWKLVKVSNEQLVIPSEYQ